MQRLNSITIADDGQTAIFGGGVYQDQIVNYLYEHGKVTGKYRLFYVDYQNPHKVELTMRSYWSMCVRRSAWPRSRRRSRSLRRLLRSRSRQHSRTRRRACEWLTGHSIRVLQPGSILGPARGRTQFRHRYQLPPEDLRHSIPGLVLRNTHLHRRQTGAVI